MIAVFLLGTGYFFIYNIFLTGIGTMDETFQNMGILLITLMPVITMRLFSGEYTGRTMELLMTLPLKPWQIVLGKYLGAVTHSGPDDLRHRHQPGAAVSSTAIRKPRTILAGLPRLPAARAWPASRSGSSSRR